jgi:hypothetical protein
MVLMVMRFRQPSIDIAGAGLSVVRRGAKERFGFDLAPRHRQWRRTRIERGTADLGGVH